MSETQLASRSPMSLKRERDEDDDLEKPPHIPDSEEFISSSIPPFIERNTFEETSTRGSSHVNKAVSPARSSTGSLSDAGTTTPSKTPNAPATTPTALARTFQPSKKRMRLTSAEKEERRLLKAARDQEKAEEKARKDVEKDAEKKKKEADKEERRRMKETEKAEKEKERKAKDDEKRRKEQDKQRLEDEKKKKKEKAQPKLNAFFKASNTVSKEDSPRKPQYQTSGALEHSASALSIKSPNKNNATSYYEEKFQPFFVQSGVRIAPTTHFTRDEKASKALQETIDSCSSGCIHSEGLQPFDAARLFNVPDAGLKSRGRKITSVRKIMSPILGDAKRPIDLTTDSQHLKTQNARDVLKTVPFKILSFAEDIRPSYKGTYTSQPITSMHKLARCPTRRDLPQVNYDYDSEAEWEAEDGEDIVSEGDEDEDVGEGEEDLDGFVDDAEAETVNARKLVLQADLEPKCSGLCWEDEKRCGPNGQMCGFVMELITENNQISLPIDPWAKHYWDIPAAAGLMEPPRVPLNAMKSTNASLNGPDNALKFLGKIDVAKSTAQGSNMALKKLVSAEDMPAFRQAINGSELSKLGLIEVLNKQFSKISKSTIKCTLEAIARRVGSKEAEKRWMLVDGPTT